MRKQRPFLAAGIALVLGVAALLGSVLLTVRHQEQQQVEIGQRLQVRSDMVAQSVAASVGRTRTVALVVSSERPLAETLLTHSARSTRAASAVLHRVWRAFDGSFYRARLLDRMRRTVASAGASTGAGPSARSLLSDVNGDLRDAKVVSGRVTSGGEPVAAAVAPVRDQHRLLGYLVIETHLLVPPASDADIGVVEPSSGRQLLGRPAAAFEAPTPGAPMLRHGRMVAVSPLPGPRGSAPWLATAAVDAPSLGLDDVTAEAIVLAILGLAGLGAAAALVVRTQRSTEVTLREANRRLSTDVLTGVLNRRGVTAHARSREWSGVLLVDVDHFKRVNDVHGHPAGDRALTAVAGAIAAAVGGAGRVGRWGGEEFIVLVDDASRLRELGERVRAAVAAVPVALRGGGELALTVSVGGAEADTDRLEDVVGAADEALYAAKGGGRNCLRLYTELRPRELAPALADRLRAADDHVAAACADDAALLAHSREVSTLAAKVAERLGLESERIAATRLAGLLHDLGKTAVPRAVLHKPGPLTPAERATMERHPEVGAGLVAATPGWAHVAELIRHHHERVDGTGYPDRLAGPTIPLESRILAAADAYSAMTTRRSYAPTRTPSQAEAELLRVAGSQLDGRVVDALLSVLDDQATLDTRERLTLMVTPAVAGGTA
jgi:diguanylate cyclase (GGDEF)-like protein/putative nucleotidyltransferase with HDIG domain